MSHHSMGAFFSGTDTSTLQKEGNDTNCFVSLIVDTQGTYKAAITRKISFKREVTIVDKGSSYEFFGEGTQTLGSSNLSKQVDTEEIQYFMLDVERHEVDNPLAALDTRFDEIIASKKQAAAKTVIPSTKTAFNNSITLDEDFYPWLHKMQNANVEEPYLFDKDTIKEMTVTPLAEEPEIEYIPNKRLIHEAVCRMVTCSFILNIENFNLKMWVDRHMQKLYKKIFTSDIKFKDWTDFIVSFSVYHFEDLSALETLDDETFFACVGEAMITELDSLKNEGNPYIDRYIEEINSLIGYA